MWDRWSAARSPSGLALFQFWGDWVQIGIVVAIFAFGQFFEGNICRRSWWGARWAASVWWLLFALSAFGSIFGFVGMLVAVPVAAMLGVLTARDRALPPEPALSGRRGPSPPRKDKTCVSRQLVFDLPAREALGRGDFFVSPSNALALAALDVWRGWPGGRMLWSVRRVGQDPPRPCLGAESAAEIVTAGRPDRGRGADACRGAGLVVEDADRIAGDAGAEAALFHLNNMTGRGASSPSHRAGPGPRLGPQPCPIWKAGCRQWRSRA